MAKQEIKLGRTDYSVLVFIPDPASTDGSGKTGLNAAALTVSYTRMETDNDVTVTDVTSSLSDLSALTDAHTDWGVKEVSSTLAPGLYRLDLADAVLASGIWSAVVYVMITTSAAAASPMEFIAVAYDPLDSVRLGLTGLANATPGAAGGLVIAGSNAATTFAGITSSAGIVVTQSAADTAGVAITGNGTASGLKITGGATGAGLDLNGGGTSGSAMTLQTTSGSGIVIVPTAGHGISIVADGTSKHGITVTGGTAGTSDGIKAVAGSGGVPIRGDITANITGTLSTVTTLTNLPAITANWLTAAGTAADFGAEVADAVWDEAIAGHAGAGSTGEALSAAGAAGDPWITALPGAYGAGSAGKIVGDNINATISSRASQASLDTVDDFLDTEIAAIKAKTDNLPTDPADASDIAGAFSTLSGKVDVIDDFLDTEVAAILAAVDTEVAAIKTKTDSLNFTVAGLVDSNQLRTNGDATAAANEAKTTRAIVRCTVGALSSSTSIITSACAPVGVDADQFKGRIITFDADTTTTGLRGQATDITASTAAAAPVFTVTALTQAPVSGDTFSIT